MTDRKSISDQPEPVRTTGQFVTMQLMELECLLSRVLANVPYAILDMDAITCSDLQQAVASLQRAIAALEAIERQENGSSHRKD